MAKALYHDDEIVPRGDVAGAKLASRTRTSFQWTMGGQWVSFVVQFVTGLIIAREVGAEVIGVVTIAYAFAMYADQLKSLGLSQAVIQRSNLTYGDLNALFWANTAVGVVLALVMSLLGPLLALAKDKPELVPICLLLGLSYIFSALEVQPAALLSRQLRFKHISVRNTAARIIASAIALVVVYTVTEPEYRYLSPVLVLVLYSFFSSLFVWLATDWRPGLPRNLTKSREAIAFGLHIQTGELFNVTARSADYMLIGFLPGGATALGLYRKAYDTMMTPIRQIKSPMGSVVQPLMASVRDDARRYSKLYLSVISGLSHIAAPGLVGLIIFAEPTMVFLLTDEFRDAAPMLQWLCVAGIAQLVTSTAGWLLTTRERAKEYARMSMWLGIFTVVTFVAGLPWGAYGVAVAYGVGQVVAAPFMFHYCASGSGVTLRSIGGALYRPLAVAAMVGAPMVVTRYFVEDFVSGWQVLIGVVVALATWALVLWVWKSARLEMERLVGITRNRNAEVTV